jgi:hypothetical protein
MSREQFTANEGVINKFGTYNNYLISLIASYQKDADNKAYQLSVISVNNNGDKYTNDSGDRAQGDNFSLSYKGQTLRVQNGPQVKHDSALDKYLEKLSTVNGSVAYVDGVLYVRDNSTWYVIEKRSNSGGDSWNTLKEDFKLNYTSAPSNSDYTTSLQYGRNVHINNTTNKSYWTSNKIDNINRSTVSGNGDDLSILVGNDTYNITVGWLGNVNFWGFSKKPLGYSLDELEAINNNIETKYPDAISGDIIYYDNNYWIYSGYKLKYQSGTNYTGGWGVIFTGDYQDKEAKDAEKLFEALKNR